MLMISVSTVETVKMELTKKQAFWKQHLESLESFDGTTAEYARQHDLEVKKLYVYKTAFRERLALETQTTSSFVRVTKATTLAREQSERIVRADYDTVVAANYPPDNYTTMAGYEQFQRTVTITNDTPKANAKTITVRVSWRNNARITKTAVLSTVIIQ